jgi:hypothetical protein
MSTPAREVAGTAQPLLLLPLLLDLLLPALPMLCCQLQQCVACQGRCSTCLTIGTAAGACNQPGISCLAL